MEDSPVNRQRKALDQFAASMSAQNDSKVPLSPKILIKKENISHLSINKQDQSEARTSDLPLLIVDMHKNAQNGSQLGKLSDLQSPQGVKKRISALHILEEARESQNKTLMEMTNKVKNDVKRAPRQKISNPFINDNLNKNIVRIQESEYEAKSDDAKSPRHNREKHVREFTFKDQVIIGRLKQDEGSINSSRVQQNDDTSSPKMISTSNFKLKLFSRGDDTSINEPLPLLQKGIYTEEPEVMWKKRRLKQNLAINKMSQAEQELQQEREEFEKAQRLAHQVRKKADQQVQYRLVYNYRFSTCITIFVLLFNRKLQAVQERLFKSAESIKVTSNISINLKEYPQYFKYKIYECFKPTNLQETRSYIEFLTSNDSDQNNYTVGEEDLPPELYSYLSKDMETKLPSYINQQKLLQFDSNFESGNLDSVYLGNEENYNLLCKSDTNTKGNTYWFYFKVLNWNPKAKATFNLLNVARDLTPFYSKGMNIWTRTESSNGIYKSDWQCQNNVSVISFQQNDIVRSKSGKKEYACGRYYNTLKFKVEFPEIVMLNAGANNNSGAEDTVSANGYSEEGPNDLEQSPGTVMCFAYALPYTYSDLMSDLADSKKFLLNNGGIIINQQQEQSLAHKMMEKTVFRGSQDCRSKMPSKRQKLRELTDRQVLTKNEIATREMKKMAIKTCKERMGQFEIQLLKADEETASPLIKQLKKPQNCKLLEIHTDYLYYKQEIVSQSVGGLNIYQITLTKRKGTNCLPFHRKKCMYITARLHSAETHGSLIMKYIMQELVTRSENFDSILSSYVIKLVPLINTDGVTIGNSRSSLVGLDLNRRWADPNPSIHPEIYFLKKTMQQQADSQQGISIYCDLHGHNRKENCFFYGCNKAADEGMLSWTKTRLLPKIFASVEQIFDFQSCRFKQDKYKLNTARVVVWNEMKVTNSFTLETSQYAKTLTKAMMMEDPSALTDSIQSTAEKQKLTHIQLQMKDMHQIAKSLLVASAQYSKLEKELEKEWKLSVGWFKPSRLAGVTGEAIRDKHKRELKQKKQGIKESGKNVPQVGRKRIERINSSLIQIEPMARKRVGKMNSNSKVVTSETKTGNGKESILPLGQGKIGNRQQSLLNVNLLGPQDKEMTSKNSKVDKKGNNSSATTKRNLSNKGDKEDGEVIQGSADKQLLNMAVAKKKQLKGPKISATVNHEDFSMQDSNSQSIVTKLKSWKEFFDPEEFQNGIACMKESMKALTERSDEDEGSDSEPSVDNYEQEELEENLCAALDLEEGEANPFERPFQEEIEPSIKIPSEKEENRDKDNIPSDDNMSINSMEQQIMAKEEVASLGEEDNYEEDKDSSADPANIESQQQQNSEIEEPQVATVIETKVNQFEIRGRGQQGPKQQRQNKTAAQLEQERLRVANYPDLANQLINQLIMQNNVRMMKSSAAPPSGSAQQASNSNNYNQEFAQTNVLRGISYVNSNQPSSSSQAPQSTPDQNQQQNNTVYFTDQQRRIKDRNPSTQFTLVGQNVKSLNTTQQNESSGGPRRPRKVQPTTKGLTPLPTQQLAQMFEEGSVKGGSLARRAIQDTRLNRQQMGSGAVRNAANATKFHSESRGQANRNYAASKSPNQSHLHVMNRGGIRNDNLRVDNSQEVNSQRNQMNETLGSSSSKLVNKTGVRNSQQRFYQASMTMGPTRQQDVNQKKIMLEQQRVQEAHRHYEQTQQLASGIGNTVYQIRHGIDTSKGPPNTSYCDSSLHQNQILPINQTLELRKAQNREKLPDTGRYSHIRQTSEDGTFMIDTMNTNIRSPQIGATLGPGAGNRFMQQFAYSPIQHEDACKRTSNAELNQMSAPHASNKPPSFSTTPRHKRLIKNQNLKLAHEVLMNQTKKSDSVMGNGLEIRGVETAAGYNSAANQTGYSGGFNVDPKGSRAISYDRKYSEMNSTHSQFKAHQPSSNMMVSSPNSYEVHKDIVNRSSFMQTKVYHQATAGISFDDRPMMHHSSGKDKVDNGAVICGHEQVSAESGSVITNSQTQKYGATPIILPGKEVTKRKNRNLRASRPNQNNMIEGSLINSPSSMNKIKGQKVSDRQFNTQNAPSTPKVGSNKRLQENSRQSKRTAEEGQCK